MVVFIDNIVLVEVVDEVGCWFIVVFDVLF